MVSNYRRMSVRSRGVKPNAAEAGPELETGTKRFITVALKRVAKAKRLTKSSNERMDRTDLLIKTSTARCIKKQ
jgi:hypothetical protein